MSEETKFDHFKDINELLKHIDSWYREDDIEYTRWFGLTDLYNLKIYITSLQQKVEQLENIRKEAIEFMKENCDIITIDKGWIIRSELTTTGLGKLFKILNKGE